MSVPQRRLEVSDIPGYHLHWFRDSNIARAIQAGYEFVEDKEVELNQGGVATSKDISGNADLGSRVRVVSGLAADGSTEYLTLMKLREEFWVEDRKQIDARNADIMSAIFRDEQILGSEKVSPEDQGTRYVKTALFNRPARKGSK
jgi:hypothetical protein